MLYSLKLLLIIQLLLPVLRKIIIFAGKTNQSNNDNDVSAPLLCLQSYHLILTILHICTNIYVYIQLNII